MPQTRTFLIPDYYTRFACKADRCRTNCCHGWTITISMQDYFNLLGVPCSQELRRKLDAALHLVKDPSPERYAQILPNWLGNCPLQREDGLCALQCECGEGFLSSTCRYYPRGVRTAFADECCCSGSCEGVLETMFAQKEPIRMMRRELTFDMELPPSAEQGRTADEDCSIQKAWVLILQDRAYPLPQRLQRLGCAAHALHQSEEETAVHMMRTALETFEPVQEKPGRPAFDAALDMLQHMADCSENIGSFAQRAMNALGVREDCTADEAFSRFLDAAHALDSTLPDWPIYFEHMLVNHILYQGYPYSPQHESVWDEYMALCALYAVLRTLTVGYMADGGRLDDFVDVCAAAFKLFDHSPFDHNAMVVLRRQNMADEAAMRRLTSL